jgi:hypothetical protein
MKIKAICIKTFKVGYGIKESNFIEGEIYDYERLLIGIMNNDTREYRIHSGDNHFKLNPQFFKQHLMDLELYREKQLKDVLNER